MKKTYLFAVVLSVLFLSGQQAKALSMSDQPAEAYQPTIIFKASNLTLSVTPSSYDSGSGKWMYEFTWNRMPKRSGSVYIILNKSSDVHIADASGQGSNNTGYNLDPDTRYRIIYYSQANGRGVRIVDGYFKTLPAGRAGYNAGVQDGYSSPATTTPIATIVGLPGAPRVGGLIAINGTVYYIGQNRLYGVPDSDTFSSWGWRFSQVLPANDAEKVLPQTSILPRRAQDCNNPVDQINGACGIIATPPPTPLNKLGDANLDGQVTIADSLKIQLHADGTTLLTGQALANSDVTGEGTVNGIDAILVANYYGGMITQFPKTDGSTLLLGDANRNGTVNIGDSVVIGNHVAGTAKITGRALDNADVDGDGKITNNDATLVANYAGCLINSFPRGTPSGTRTCATTQLTITTSSPLPSVQVGSSYSADVSASGGSDSYSWRLTSGALPAGLSLVSGVCIMAPCKSPVSITGTPTFAGDYTFTLTLTSGHEASSKDFIINVSSGSTGGGISLTLGDVNNDNQVTIADSLKIQLHADGTTLLTGQALANADVTGEGKVNGIDALIVAQYAGHLITAFPKTDGSTLMLGDANLNGSVSIGDSVVIANYVNGNTSALVGRGLDNADVDGDGKITNNDATLVANFAGHVISYFPRSWSL